MISALLGPESRDVYKNVYMLVLILFLMLPSMGIKFRSDGSPDTAVLPYPK